MISERDARIIRTVRNTDEPIIVFRAQDTYAVNALIEYYTILDEAGATEVANAVRDRVDEFMAWQDKNSDRVKIPDLREGEKHTGNTEPRAEETNAT